MYTIELDVDPVTLGFDPKEVSRKNDGTFVVTRKFFRVAVWDPYSDLGGEAWCPCSHEITDGANWSHGGHYWVDDGPEQTYGRNRVINHLVGERASDRYGVKLTAEEENNIKYASFCATKYPNDLRNHYPRYIREGAKIRLGSPPNDPYHDPFLPEKFKQMLGNAYVGDGNA